MDSGKLLLLGGLGAGAWWLYSNYSTPTTATTPAGTTTSTTTTSTTTATSTPPTGPSTATTSPTGSPVTSPSNLAQLWAQVLTWAAVDQQFTKSGSDFLATPYHWNYYVGYVWPTAPSGFKGTTWPPDVSVVFPGVDLTQPMSGTAFWAGMLPYLTGQGLSGYWGMGSADPTMPTQYESYDVLPGSGDSGILADVYGNPLSNVTFYSGNPTIATASSSGALGIAAIGLLAVFLLKGLGR